ncbi:hypothetical protein N2152v2_008111 [Parachlorella kessleri]
MYPQQWQQQQQQGQAPSQPLQPIQQQQQQSQPGFPWQHLEALQAQANQLTQAQQQPVQQQQQPYAAYYQQPQPQPQAGLPQQQPQQQPQGVAWGPAGMLQPQQPQHAQQPQQQYQGQLQYQAGTPMQQPTGLPQIQGLKSWVGIVTQLLPPNYGIVDGDAYYIHPVVVGEIPKMGDRVRCEAVGNTEGGAYKWRITRLELDRPPQAPAPGPGPAMPAGMPPGAYMQQAQQLQPQAQQAQYMAGRPLTQQQQGAAAAGGTAHMGSNPRRGHPSGPQRLTEEQRERLAGEKYNLAPPPLAQYSSEVALAAVEMSLGGSAQQAQAPAGVDRRAVFAPQRGHLDEEARKRAQETVQQLGMDTTNPGARLLTKMGFGAVGSGLGRNQQGISAPINPVSISGNVGLGFDKEAAEEEERKEREARWAAREKEREERRVREREREKEREKERERRRSRSRSRSPARPRYACAPPKWPTYEGPRGVASLSKRYKDLYLPSDFVQVNPLWQRTCPESAPFPLDRPFTLNLQEPAQEESSAKGKESRKDSHKDSKGPAGKEGSVAPPSPKAAEGAAVPAAGAGALATGHAGDLPPLSEEEIESGRRWSVRVAVVSGVPPETLYAGEKDAKRWQHPHRRMQFLVMKPAKHEFGLIGGAWDPADGGHPDKDPRALLNTALRTFKAATGRDLAPCTHWAPLVEVSYLRAGGSGSGGSDTPAPDRFERCRVLLVDASPLAEADDTVAAQLERARGAKAGEEAAWGEVEAAEAAAKEAEKASKDAAEKVAARGAGASKTAELAALDPPSLNVQQLQEELTKRGLDTKWNPLQGKKVLVERLQERVAQQRAALTAGGDSCLTKALPPPPQEHEQVAQQRTAAAGMTRALSNLFPRPRRSMWPSGAQRWQQMEHVAQQRAALAAQDAEFKAAEDAKAAVEAALHKAATEAKAAVKAALHKLGLRDGEDVVGRKTAAEAKLKEAKERHRQARAAKKDAEKLLADPPAPCKLSVRAAGEALDKRGRSVLSVVTLDQLLDYSDEDTREAGFEAALFAEAFQEMLQQRFGRGMLRALGALAAGKAGASDKDKDGDKEAGEGAHQNGKAPKEAASDAGDNGKESGKDGQVSAPLEEGQAPAGTAADRELADGEVDGSGSKKRAAAAAGDGAAAEVGGVAKRAKKEVPAEPSPAGVPPPLPPAAGAAAGAAAGDSSGGDPLLLCCRYFDRECAGYLLDEDLEEVAYMVAQDLSRKRIQSLVDAVTKRGKFSYVDHAGLRVPPVRQAGGPAQPAAMPAGLGGAVAGGGLLSAVNGDAAGGDTGAAEELSLLRQQLAIAEQARKAAEAAKGAAEGKLAEVESEHARAAQQLQHATAQLQQAKQAQQAGEATHHRRQVAEAARALEVLRCAEAAAGQLGGQLAELGALLAKAAEVKQEEPPSQATADRA